MPSRRPRLPIAGGFGSRLVLWPKLRSVQLAGVSTRLVEEALSSRSYTAAELDAQLTEIMEELIDEGVDLSKAQYLRAAVLFKQPH